MTAYETGPEITVHPKGYSGFVIYPSYLIKGDHLFWTWQALMTAAMD